MLKKVLDEGFAALAAADADVILFGGDYVFLDARYFDDIASRAARLQVPLGLYAVMGNHDLWADDAAIVGQEQATVTDSRARALRAPSPSTSRRWGCRVPDPHRRSIHARAADPRSAGRTRRWLGFLARVGRHRALINRTRRCLRSIVGSWG